jgi:type IV secretory pathway TraG/TraD family ATPase VirD4
MTGVETVQKASFNFSGSRLSPIMGHVNASVDHIERPLMTPDEILRLTPARKEGHGDSEQIVSPGQMLIFVSGHYPILGTQMLYFTDPALAERKDRTTDGILFSRSWSDRCTAFVGSHTKRDESPRDCDGLRR